MGAEDLHLLVREVCVGKNGLNLYKTFAQLLVGVPDMFADGETAAEAQEREHCGGEVFTWFALLPVRSTGETDDADDAGAVGAENDDRDAESEVFVFMFFEISTYKGGHLILTYLSSELLQYIRYLFIQVSSSASRSIPRNG